MAKGLTKTQKDKKFVKSQIHEFQGELLSFAKHLHSLDNSRTIQGWRGVASRLKQHQPDLFAWDDVNYNDMLPKEWDGTPTGLAKRMYRQDPSISLNAWRMRINTAFNNGAITTSHRPEFVVEHLKKENKSHEDLWADIEAISKKAIANVEHARWADIHMQTPEDKFIGIAFQSDQHIGNPFCDHEQLRIDTELIANSENVFVIHAGDYIDNFIIDKPRPAMKASIPPSVQWKLCEHYLDMSVDSLMAVVAGNHDLWTAGMTDFDPLKRFVEERGVLYHAHELNLRVWVAEIPYHISVRHKRRGNSNLDPSRVIKKMWDDGEADFDIGVVGHHHTPLVSPFTKHGQERWAVRPGAYKIVDSFGEMCGFPREKPTSPMVILNPHTKEIQGFTDLRMGLRTLAALNGDEYDEDLGIQ
jgi:predicted phosphodiesterase